MRLSVTGLNHRTAPVVVRERMAFDPHALPSALQSLKLEPGVLEGLILSTCNRVEVAVTMPDDADPRVCVEHFLAQQKTVDPAWFRPHLYQLEGQEAVRHIFRVASSLDSMVVGEPQILGQLKSAYALAKSQGILNGYLDTLLTRAFGVAKRVRTETEIGRSAVSISYAAVELAREIFGTLRNSRILLVGAGKMSELAARHLHRSGASQIFVTNRTYPRAVAMAKLFNGVVVDYNELLARLPEMDIVITSSGAPEPILHKDEMRRVMELRRNRPMFLIDIAVPRNVEPAVNELESVFLYDIDDLQRVVDQNVQGRLTEVEQANAIISEEVERMQLWLRSREAGPTIRRLQDQWEAIRVGEVERLRSRLGPLTPQQELALEALTRGMLNKIAHGPISELRREAASPEGGMMAETLRRAFRLEDS